VDAETQSALEAIGPVNPNGLAMADELRRIHGYIRGNLGSIRELTSRVVNGEPGDRIRESLEELQASGIVWQLRLGCLQYCRFVHSHHSLEDAALFPGIRRANPTLNSVVETLIADHRRVAVLLDRVERTSTALDVVPAARRELVEALEELANHLLKHLDFEEQQLIPTLSRLRQWPGYEPLVR
jgi:hypothetical protein